MRFNCFSCIPFVSPRRSTRPTEVSVSSHCTPEQKEVLEQYILTKYLFLNNYLRQKGSQDTPCNPQDIALMNADINTLRDLINSQSPNATKVEVVRSIGGYEFDGATDASKQKGLDIVREFGLSKHEFLEQGFLSVSERSDFHELNINLKETPQIKITVHPGVKFVRVKEILKNSDNFLVLNRIETENELVFPPGTQILNIRRLRKNRYEAEIFPNTITPGSLPGAIYGV